MLLYLKRLKLKIQWEGQFYNATYDLAFMIPMVEMAGTHTKYIKEIFYIYNRVTPLNDVKIRAQRQQRIAQYILNLPCYAQLSSLSSDGFHIENRK